MKWKAMNELDYGLATRNEGTQTLKQNSSCSREPRLHEPLYNEVLGIRNDFHQPGQSYRKMNGTEPRFK